MIRLFLVLALVGVGTDALLYNGAYTQRTWRGLSSEMEKLDVVAPQTNASSTRE